MLGEGVPEPGSCPGEGSVHKTVTFGLKGGKKAGVDLRDREGWDGGKGGY